MAFYVGQKVVCVNKGLMTTDTGGIRDAPSLKVGSIYTVERIYTSRGLLGLVLVEVGADYGGLAFNAKRFRPVVERKTDISIFTAMLNPSKTEVTA